ncbi:hypothetical protein OAK75_01585 [Bacteriovoracales bacterium]|nr:hypothetical protein [Bacteriovoracales bacterium]
MADILKFKIKKNKDFKNDPKFNTLMLQKIMDHIYCQVKINIDKGFQGGLYDLIGVYCKANKNDKRLKEVFIKEILDRNNPS